MQSLEQGRVSAISTGLVLVAAREVSPVGNILQGLAVGPVLQVLCAQNAGASTGVYNIVECNLARSTVISLPLGGDRTADIGVRIAVDTVGLAGGLKFNRRHLGSFERLGAGACGVSEHLLVSLGANQVPGNVVWSSSAEVGD